MKKLLILKILTSRVSEAKCDLTSADGDGGAAWMKMDYSSEPITP